MEGANLYFLNPAGFLFGQNATLDISGSFHVSTADYLTLDDELGHFDTVVSADSTLTAALPQTFGFLDATVGTIELDGASLEVSTGEGLHFVGEDIELKGDAFFPELSSRAVEGVSCSKTASR